MPFVVGILGSCDAEAPVPTAAPTAIGSPVSPVASPLPVAIPERPSADARALVAEIELVEDVLHDPTEPAERLRAAGELQQLACRKLARAPGLMERVTPLLSPRARRSMTAALTGIRELSVIVPAQEAFPRDWRIVAPPPADGLLGFFEEGERRFGVAWGTSRRSPDRDADGPDRRAELGRRPGADAVHPVDVGRVRRGATPRGARRGPRRGPAAYAPTAHRETMDNATYRYNPSWNYVAGIESHARHMLADPRAFYGYHAWRVFYRHVDGEFILPVGYPKTRPEPAS